MRYAIRKLISGAALALAPQTAAAQAQAQEPAAEPVVAAPALSLELHVLEPREGACRFVVVAENRLGGDLVSAVFETVIFDREGRVERLTLFDFNDLPEGRVRVRSFDLGGVDC